MSATPRTDARRAELSELSDAAKVAKLTTFAAELERELAACRLRMASLYRGCFCDEKAKSDAEHFADLKTPFDPRNL
jgi:hypothetical protein